MTWTTFILMILGGLLLSYGLASIIANKIDKWVKDTVRSWYE